ncbi:uncharacterized protein LOC131951721 isoform X2 [Physella acuta]|uniref:uncharacterized protein LOC131951721 isoform X2 n=1 Tax=Physella acuta TaxID=109671 RepID=UPI0027DD99B3|nr:uncharacterized protein LOC131951721 isoform X2 [Physella acuta]
MSRMGGLTKPRGTDKSKPPTSQTPTASHDIVPGKFNENDWNYVLERDTAEDFAFDLVEEIISKTLSVIYDRHIESQLLPFTISQAKEAIVEIIKWQFLTRDEGEENFQSDSSWHQDEEPEPASTDCWAQGSVPKTIIRPKTPIIEVQEIIPEEVEPSTTEENLVEAAIEEMPDFVSETQEPVELGLPDDHKTDQETTETLEAKAKAKFRPYRGKLKTPKIGNLTESLDETEMKLFYNELSQTSDGRDKQSTVLTMPASCTSLIKFQNGRPPGNKEVMYDDMGNVIGVIKLDPDKLPTHKVNIKYTVVDPLTESSAKLDLNRKGKSMSKIRRIRSKTFSKDVMLKEAKSKLVTLSQSANISSLPPSLIEEMEVARGVIIREGSRVKKGPGLYYRKLDMLEENFKGMQPISLRAGNPGITVNDLLDRTTPILRPLGDISPLPPIVPHPPLKRPQFTV